jgi:copper chaperone CopZ
LGIIAGGLLTAIIPRDIASRYLSNPLIAYPLVLAFALPMYVCAIGAVPIAAALLLKGLTPGAALTFMIAGPATNTVTLAFVGQKLGKKILILYVTAIVGSAIAFGIIFDIVVSSSSISNMLSPGNKIPLVIQLPSVLLILSLFVWTFIHKKSDDARMDFSFYVPNMTCTHCAMTIEQAVKQVSGVTRVKILPDKKVVKIDGTVDEDVIKKQIENAGYTVERNQQTK